MSSKNINTEQQIIFLHIPKTAGSTLEEIIARQYPPQSVYVIAPDPPDKPGSLQKFKNMSETRRAEIRVLKGHIHINQRLHEFLPGPVTYFTILRDPVERVISQYYFIRDRSTHYLYDIATSKSLKELLQGRHSIMWYNAHVRMLSGVWDDVGIGECTEETLETAKRNLRERFAVVGLTERFDETLLLLKRTYGWRNVYYTRKRVTANRPRKDELAPATLDAVTRANRLDIELYQYATTLFEEQIRQQGPLFSVKAKAFPSLNRLYPSDAFKEIRKRSIRAFIRKWTRRILGSQ